MSKQAKADGEQSRKTGELPSTISLRTENRRAELMRWRRSHWGVPWSVLLEASLDAYFAKQQKEKAA